jgi:hypothetical protein
MGGAKGRRVAVYVRVSTDGQSVENQKRELDAVAKRHEWEVVEVFSDHGVSGAKDRRPAFDRMLKGVARKDFDMVAGWSVDRLGRSLRHLLGFLDELKANGVDMYLHQQGLDTSTPAGRMLYQMVEFSRSSSGHDRGARPCWSQASEGAGEDPWPSSRRPGYGEGHPSGACQGHGHQGSGAEGWCWSWYGPACEVGGSSMTGVGRAT